MNLPPALPSVPIIVEDDDDTGFSRYFATLVERRWLILKITLVMLLAGSLYALVARPIYEASMLIHVEEPSMKESNNILGEMATLFDVKTTTPSEMELLRSRLVISRAIEALHLSVEVRPRTLPVLGQWFAQHTVGTPLGRLLARSPDAVAAPTNLSITALELPTTLEGREVDLTVASAGTFHLQQAAQGIDALGRVGEPLRFATERGPGSIFVSRLDAAIGTRFTIRRRPLLQMVEEIQKSLVIAEQGKQSGVINITLQGDNASAVHVLLREIGRQYIAQNLARKLEESQKSLAFLDKQLPDLQQQLESAETRYSEFRNRYGTVDVGEEEKLALQQMASANTRRLALQQRRLELLPHFTPRHPVVMALDQQLREISGEITMLTSRIRTMPLLEQRVQRLQREVKVNTDLYNALSNTAQQLRLITIGKVGNVRLVDTPMMPETPIAPNRPRILLLAAVVGLLGSSLLILIHKAIYGGLDRADQIETLLQIPVFATIPHSRRQRALQRRLPVRSGQGTLLACVASDDAAIESMRIFRTALRYSMASARNNIVMVSGPMPGVGKTFVTANLAAVMALTCKRVMLIDSDFRNGVLHDYLDVPAKHGLADYLQGQSTLAQVIHRNVTAHLDFIATGSLPRHPAELLLSPRLGTLLVALARVYDVVIIDAAPTLAVSDSLIVGAHAGSIFLVARSNVTTGAELQESVKRMGQSGLNARGVIFNDVALRPGASYGYGYGYGRVRAEPAALSGVARTGGNTAGPADVAITAATAAMKAGGV